MDERAVSSEQHLVAATCCDSKAFNLYHRPLLPQNYGLSSVTFVTLHKDSDPDDFKT